jgi:endoglucanase
MLPQKDAWRAYKARFVTAQGRVVDTANGLVSHSEGQGYGMLLAVAADDRDSFERIWGWTRANLFIRNDALAAWRWEPDKRPAIADVNNASDGDLLIAWALVEAATAWPDPSYRVAARRMALDIGRKLVLFNTPNLREESPMTRSFPGSLLKVMPAVIERLRPRPYFPASSNAALTRTNAAPRS